MNRCTRVAALIVGTMLFGGQIRAEPAQEGYSAAALYNLANSFARAGRPGMAVLNYERAGLLAPNDPDIEANLRLVRESTHQPVRSRNWFERIATMASPEATAWLGIIGILTAGASLLTGVLSVRFRWLRRMGTVAGIGLVGLNVCNAVVLWPTLHAGVIISAQADVRVSPVPMGDSLFVLPEAETVMIKAEHEGFVLIETRTGRTGWVSRASLASVVSR
ncbi:MAG TPA: tetratricopeptide repeat protein [Steroidobacteraceae bacterium]|jgi:hypothetical protein